MDPDVAPGRPGRPGRAGRRARPASRPRTSAVDPCVSATMRTRSPAPRRSARRSRASLVAEELGDRTAQLAVRLDRQVDEALRAEPACAARSARRSRGGSRRPCRARRSPSPGRRPPAPSRRRRSPTRAARRVDERRPEVDQLHPEPHVRLVRAVPFERLVVRQDRERHRLDRPIRDGRLATPRWPSPRRSPSRSPRRRSSSRGRAG